MTDQDIIARYAALFDITGDKTSAMQWGFQGVGPGWLPIIEKMCADLASVAPVGFATASVKEKYGALRVSYRGGGEEVDAAVEAAKAEALVTCMICGVAGELREREGLWAVRCVRCAVK